MAPHPNARKNPDNGTIPSSVSKYFRIKTTAKSKIEPMDSTGRVCVLDARSNSRVLVYEVPRIKGQPRRWDELYRSEKTLFELAERDPQVRISRKPLDGTRVQLFYRDLFNEPEFRRRASEPDMSKVLLDSIQTLGFFQAQKHKYVYIVSPLSFPPQDTSSKCTDSAIRSDVGPKQKQNSLGQDDVKDLLGKDVEDVIDSLLDEAGKIIAEAERAGFPIRSGPP